MKFRDRIRSVDPSLSDIPKGYKRLGDFIILRSEVTLTNQHGIAVMQAYRWCKGVFQHKTTIGENRQPVLIHLAGSQETEIVHIENNTKYVLDFQKIMLSGGNTKLRRDLVKTINDGDYLLDMFCAIGNLSMQVLVHKRVNAVLIEKNNVTFQYLMKTVEANKLEDISCRNIDCRDLDLELWADHVFLGYHNVDQTHLRKAIQASRTKSRLYLHPIARKDDYDEVINKYRSWLLDFDVKIDKIEVEKIKDYSPNLHHIQVIFSIEK